MATVLQTDFAWPDVTVERAVIEAAGHRLVTGPSVPASMADIERLVEEHRPEAIMTCWAEVSARAIAIPDRLTIVQRLGVGLDNIAVAAATARGAWVANVPDYCVSEVSDHAIALLLDWARGVTCLDRSVKDGCWDPAGAKLRRISDLRIGIIGYGRIGQATAAKLRAFGCVVSFSRRRADAPGNIPLNDLVGDSDVIIIHAPLTPKTHHLVDADLLTRFKPGAFLINVSRGAIVENQALLVALQSGRLSGAGLDVIEGEPEPPRDLVTRPDVIVTPHVAFSSQASLDELRRRAAEEVVRVLAGEMPLNPCNHPEHKA